MPSHVAVFPLLAVLWQGCLWGWEPTSDDTGDTGCGDSSTDTDSGSDTGECHDSYYEGTSD